MDLYKNSKPCIFCNKQLESSFPDNLPYQPYMGGEVQFTFGYGSCKFDLMKHGIGSTIYRAMVCDDCAEKFVDRMEEQ